MAEFDATRILLANANTTQAVTDAIVAEARHHAAPGTEIIGGTGTFGVAIISTDAENAIAGHAMLDLLAAYPDVDAAVLATSFDTGLAGAQALMPYPIIGMTNAALHTACAMTRRFGLITFGQGSRSMYLDLVAWSGVGERMAGCSTTVELASAAAYLITPGWIRPSSKKRASLLPLAHAPSSSPERPRPGCRDDYKPRPRHQYRFSTASRAVSGWRNSRSG